jgi:hypothetical protein
MSRPIAYEPVQGQKYQILVKIADEQAYEHCDYAVDKKELIELVSEHKIAYHGAGYFKTILLPQKYWPKKNKVK